MAGHMRHVGNGAPCTRKMIFVGNEEKFMQFLSLKLDTQQKSQSLSEDVNFATEGISEAKRASGLNGVSGCDRNTQASCSG